jgi:hypothetical protein
MTGARSSQFWASAVLVFASGCGDESVSLGEGERFAGSWEGYAEAYEFDSGSDRVRLTLDSRGQGTLEIGEREPLPPATDPDADYPPGVPQSTHYEPELLAGFRYPVRRARARAGRLQFAVEPADLYREWCSIQPPLLDETSSDGETPYRCVLNRGYETLDGVCTLDGEPGGPRLPVSCGKLARCTSICGCREEGCRLDEPRDIDGLPVEFEGGLESDGRSLVGTLTLMSSPIVVRMRRAQD